MGDRLGVVDLDRKERLPRSQAFGHGICLLNIGHQRIEPLDQAFRRWAAYPARHFLSQSRSGINVADPSGSS